jgi:sec-independent protein translocase protein TatA
MTGTLAIALPQGAEWIIILLIAVLLFGAKKLPDLGSSVGKSIRNFKKGIDEGRGEEQAEETPGPVTAETTTTETTTTKTNTPS